MRFIGNKENLVEKIYHIMRSKKIIGNSFFDFFAGTTNVGRFFKKLDYQVYSSDLLYFSYILQRAYIQNNQDLTFDKLLKTINIKSNSLFAKKVLFIKTIHPKEQQTWNYQECILVTKMEK